MPSSKRLRRAALSVICISIAATLSVPTPAVADSKAKRDAAGDARVVGLDIAKVTVSYGEGSLRVRTRFAGDLADSGWLEFMYAAAPIEFEDPTLYVTFDQRPSGKKVVKVRHYQEYTGEGPKVKGCKPKGSWSTAKDLVVVTVPYGCYKKPPAQKKTLDLIGLAVFEAGRYDLSDGIKGRFRITYN